MVTSIDELDLDKKYSYADYLQWDLGEQVELIHGKIIRASPPLTKHHQEIAFNLSQFLGPKLKPVNCKIFFAPYDVQLPLKGDAEAYTIVQPDFCVIGDLSKIGSEGCKGAPDLVIEILSPSTSQKDLGTKYYLYQEAEVKEYWVVDPIHARLDQHVLKDGKFTLLKTHLANGHLQSPTFPELHGDLSEVFAD